MHRHREAAPARFCARGAVPLFKPDCGETAKGEIVYGTDIPPIEPGEAAAPFQHGIYELLARTYVVRHGGNLARQMHRKTVELVCAAAQARAARIIAPLLEPEEAEVFRRGRNSHPHTVPKNQKPEDYALATGVEALFGWLYLNGRQHRVCQLFERIVEEEEKRRNAQ